MPDPYTVLGLPPEADAAAARARYLELARRFPPEQHPAKFAAIRAAFEQVKDIDSRVRYRLFEAGKAETADGLIPEVACRTPRRRPPLSELLDL